MLHCNRSRWILLLTGMMLVAAYPAAADVVVIDNGRLSIQVGSPDRYGYDRYGYEYDRYGYDRYGYNYRRSPQIYTDRIEDSTLINPVVIGAPIEDSILINPVIVPSRRGRTVVVPYRTAPVRDNPACSQFTSLRPACW